MVTYLKRYPKGGQKDEDRQENLESAGQILLTETTHHCLDFKIGWVEMVGVSTS